AEGCRNCKVFLEQWKSAVKNFQLVTILHVRISFGVKITNTRDVLESLRAHRAGIHAQSPADCAWNSLHPFQSAEICRTRGIRHLPQFYAGTCGNFASIDLDFLEIAAPRMNDHAADAAVANEKIRTSPDNEQRQMFIAAKSNQFRESLFRARLDPKLRGTANAQRRMVRQRLVKADLTVFAHNSL